MRFSRRSLNIIIFCCLGIISWIHLGQSDIETEPLEPLNLPPLGSQPWQSWQSREGLTSYWQQKSSEKGQVRIALSQRQINWTLPAQNWDAALREQVSNAGLPAQTEASAILLHGPWSALEMQAISAYLIKHLALTQSNSQSRPSLGHCEHNFPAGSLWFRDHWSAPQPGTGKQAPLRQQWQEFRTQQSQKLRQQWLSHSGQLDIQTDIAYHRPPADYYQRLYQQLGTSQKTAVTDYLACKQTLAAQ